ncbi:MAG: beta-CASP ribonuclease aCPSF1, partial [Candidatus Micrarchaeota archaeon]
LSSMNLALEQIDAVILTHAHLDHSGFIPYLYAYGYDGPIYCTPPTRDLTVLLQEDCVNVMNSEGGKAPYSERDIKKELTRMITREYGEVTDVTPDIRFTFHNAGHILGSSLVHLHIGEGLHNLVFSGDLKYGRTNLLDPADTRFPRIETFIIESTYGARDDIQPRLDECEARLVETIRQTVANRGKVLIPVFAVGRAQEIMLALEAQLREDNIPIYFDGMSKEASAIHTVYPEYLRKNVQRRILQNNSPFDNPMFNKVVPKERKALAESEDPCVILAPSGMLSGGTSLEFLKLMAEEPKNALIFVGYQSALSLGRKIQNGATEVPIPNRDGKLDSLKINLSVTTIDGWSGHSDRAQLLAFLRNLRPKPARVFTMHGDENKTEELARTVNKMMHVETRAPMNLDSIRLR